MTKVTEVQPLVGRLGVHYLVAEEVPAATTQSRLKSEIFVPTTIVAAEQAEVYFVGLTVTVNASITLLLPSVF